MVVRKYCKSHSQIENVFSSHGNLVNIIIVCSEFFGWNFLYARTILSTSTLGFCVGVAPSGR